jgi:hypothetical protein
VLGAAVGGDDGVCIFPYIFPYRASSGVVSCGVVKLQVCVVLAAGCARRRLRCLTG